MAIFLLASWMQPAELASRQADIIEYFAGTAKMARLGQAAGFNVLAHDILFDKHNKSSMNMNGSAGFVLLGLRLESFRGCTNEFLGGLGSGEGPKPGPTSCSNYRPNPTPNLPAVQFKSYMIT